MGLLGSIAGGLLGTGSSVIENSQNRQNVQETNRMNYNINQMNNPNIFFKAEEPPGLQLLKFKRLKAPARTDKEREGR